MEQQQPTSRRDTLKYLGAAALTASLAGIASAAETATDAPVAYTPSKKFKVLMVNGSPHKKGCTYTALSEIATALEKQGIDSEIFWLGEEPLAGCIGCMECEGDGLCFRDDLVNDFLKKTAESDGFIFGSPVHFASASGAMTSFMDRAFFCARFRDNCFTGKPAAAITSCRRAGSTATLDQLNKYIVFSNMPMVPSQYWNMVHGNTPAEVRKDAEGLQIMRTLAQNMAYLLQCLDAGKQAGIRPPTYEKRIGTNFIRE